MLTIKKVIIYIIIQDNFIINCHSLLPLNEIAPKSIQVEEARDFNFGNCFSAKSNILFIIIYLKINELR